MAKYNIFKSVYAYLIALIAFMMILGASSGLIAGIANKWIYPIERSPQSWDQDITYIPGNCMHEENEEYEVCVEREMQQAQKKYSENTGNWQYEINESLGMLIPMTLIAIILFLLHWKIVRDE